MKYFLKIYLIVFAIGLISSSCNTGKNLYTQGNYYQAVLRSIEKLRKSPNNTKAKETLANAYPIAIANYLDQIENKGQSQSEFKNTEIASLYEQLNNMYENIQRSPAAKNVVVNPNKFYTQLEKIKPNAAEEQYNAGLKFLNYGDRASAKEAYFYFLASDNFVKGYKDVSNKIDESYNLSILHVLTNLMPVHSKIYDLSANLFYIEVQKIFNQIEQKEFVRFHTIEDAKKMQINTNQLLEINFEDFIVGETHTSERLEKMEADSVKVGEITLDSGRKKDIIGTVKADVAIYKVQVISKGIVGLKISDNSPKKSVLINYNFPGEYVWFNEWGKFNGDDRALNEEQIVITDQRRINPPPPQQMFVEFTKPIYEQLRTRLFNFYRNY